MKATFGLGCFWCSQDSFKRLKGVKTMVGYMGGNTKNPSYLQVCTGRTGHAEVVQVDYDPKKVSYKKLLDVFWKAHDPTQLNRQGPDIGTQYRSVIFYHNELQKKMAEKSIREAQKKYNNKVVTALEPAKELYPAEEYHQDYYDKNKLIKLIRKIS